MKLSLYEDSSLGLAVSQIHRRFHRISWPVDAHLMQFRAMLQRIPISDFPSNAVMSKEITKNDVVLEAGCNLGGLSRQLGLYAKEVHCFEPSTKAFYYLQKNTSKLANVHPHNMGISDEEKDLPFNMEWSFSGANSIFELENVKYPKKVLAHFIGIDQACEKFNFRPTSIVLDCEGAEMDAMKGAKKTLPYVQRIYCEVHPLVGFGSTEEPMRKLLSEAGFQISTGFDRGNVLWLIAKKPSVLSPAQSNSSAR